MQRARKLQTVPPAVDQTSAIVTIETYLRAGDLDPEAIKRLEPCSVPGKENVVYDFNFGNRSANVLRYFVQEADVVREYIWCDVCLGRIGNATKPEIFEYMLRRNRGFPSGLKLALAEDGCTVVMAIRGPADAFSLGYLAEMLRDLDPCSARLRDELLKYGLCDFGTADPLH